MSTQAETGFWPQQAARTAGVLYLIIIFGGIFAEVFVRQQLMVDGDATATMQNILANETLYRLGFAVHLFYVACAVPLAFIFYRLFKPVSRNVAALALMFNMVAIAIEAANLLNHFAPVRLLVSEGNTEHLYPVAYAFVELFSVGFGISLVFFGFFCLLIGNLIIRSGFLPRFLGFLMSVAGFCYLLNSFSLFVLPELADLLFPYVLMPCLVAELSLALWLTLGSVKMPRQF